MASVPIEISSSDSDLEIENGSEVGSSSMKEPANGRILPQWGTTLAPNAKGKGPAGKSYIDPSQKRAFVSGGSSSNAYNSFRGNGNIDHRLRTINSRIANGGGTNYERISSEQALQRTLPPSILPHATSTKSNHLLESMGSSFHGTNGNYHHSAGPSIINRKSHNDDVMMYESSGSRVLPQSLMHTKSSAPMQFPSLSDYMYRAAVGEEKAAESDERLIYQAALEDLNQPKVEATVPAGLLSVELLRHQKIALEWMCQKETRSLHCLGGILADDQGLGKTISMIALIQKQMKGQKDFKSQDRCYKKTEALNLDDDDDNSKSQVQCNKKIEALNLDDDKHNGGTDIEKGKKVEESNDVKSVPEASTSTRAFSLRRPAAGTLVVCPASVLRQWARELDEKVADENKLKVLIYHGGSRTRDPGELATYDVVLTTYAIVTNEVPKQPLVDADEADERNGENYGLSSEFSVNKKRKNISNASKKGKKGKKRFQSSSVDLDCGPLARVGWFRVILDEAQMIKNHRTQVARACCTLRAKRRWCLSGTPIQNAIDDLYSYFRFLKYDPYAVYKSFYTTIKLPISKNSQHGYKKLQAVLRAVMLRRTKGTLINGKPIISLPPKRICMNKVDFSHEERAFYVQLEADSRSQFKAYAAAGTLNQNYANILLMLLRLRQACDHPHLVKGYKSDSTGRQSREMAKTLPVELLSNLLNCLEGSSALCHSCRDPPEEPVVTICGHVFCYQCVSDYLTGEDNTCPARGCKEQLGEDIVFSEATLRKSLSGDLDGRLLESEAIDQSILTDGYSSSKIKVLLDILLSNCELNSKSGFEDSTGCNGASGGPIKSIVFSQWTSMLDLVESSLNEIGIEYRRLDGTMTLSSRDKAVKDFNSKPEISVMLMSLKAGNLGLNMVAACHVILLDLWWNPTTEDQAIDRAHRIGQTRPVTVTRLTIKDTVEDRILYLQDEKRKMVASAFGEDPSGGAATRLTVEDLRYLFMV